MNRQRARGTPVPKLGLVVAALAALACLLVLEMYAGDGTATSLPVAVDLRPNFERWQLPLRKQGNRNTCSVFATVGAMEYALARKLDRGTPLSVEFANWAANRAIANDQDGHFFWEVMKGYQTRGICAEQDMPYGASFSADRQPSTSALTNALGAGTNTLVFSWIRPWDGKSNLDDSYILRIKEALAEGWPVAAGSYHSILFVGYEDNPALPGGGRFLVRDSGGGNEQALDYAATKARMSDLFYVTCDTAPSANANAAAHTTGPSASANPAKAP